MRELALFAGAGGGILGGGLLGWRTVCAVEIDRFCRNLLMQRQNDGVLRVFPIWGDIRTFNGLPWRGIVDVVSGGFPCQDISPAGKRTGIGGEKSGLWKQFARVVAEVRPRYAFIENSKDLRTRGLKTVLSDLAGMGYHAAWCVLGASEVGAPHYRKRMWILAASDGVLPANANGEIIRESKKSWLKQEASVSRETNWWPVDLVPGMDDGVANKLDRVRATGNGQVPAVARLAWETLIYRLQASVNAQPLCAQKNPQ